MQGQRMTIMQGQLQKNEVIPHRLLTSTTIMFIISMAVLIIELLMAINPFWLKLLCSSSGVDDTKSACTHIKTYTHAFAVAPYIHRERE